MPCSDTPHNRAEIHNTAVASSHPTTTHPLSVMVFSALPGVFSWCDFDVLYVCLRAWNVSTTRADNGSAPVGWSSMSSQAPTRLSLDSRRWQPSV